MTVTFALRERGKRPSWRMSDYFVDRSMIIEVSIGKEQAMSGAVLPSGTLLGADRQSLFP